MNGIVHLIDKDPTGNKLLYLVKNKKVAGGFIRHRKVVLKLKGSHQRHLADVVIPKLIIKRKRSEHLMHANNSYGFNYELLKNSLAGGRIKLVSLKDEYGEYSIPIQEILDKGDFLHFQTVGFEKQIFFTLDDIKRHKI